MPDETEDGLLVVRADSAHPEAVLSAECAGGGSRDTAAYED
jgi:hypothetical protein